MTGVSSSAKQRISLPDPFGDEGGKEGMQTVRVLVVEDNEIDLLIIDRALRSTAALEYRITYSNTLAMAFESVLSTAFDVVLLDIGLPDGSAMDGLSRLVKMLDIPIVVLTGHDCVRVANKALASGAQDFVTKSEDLCAVLARTLQFAIRRNQFQVALARSEEMLTVQHEFAKQQALQLQQKLNHFEKLASFAEYTDQCVAIVGSARIVEWCNKAFQVAFAVGEPTGEAVSLDICLSRLPNFSQTSQVEWAIASQKKISECWEMESESGLCEWGRIDVIPLPQEDSSLPRSVVSISFGRLSD